MLAVMGDPYTTFIEPALHEIESDQLTGSFGGIGCRLERDLEMNWLLYPLPDSPALAGRNHGWGYSGRGGCAAGHLRY